MNFDIVAVIGALLPFAVVGGLLLWEWMQVHRARCRQARDAQELAIFAETLRVKRVLDTAAFQARQALFEAARNAKATHE